MNAHLVYCAVVCAWSIVPFAAVIGWCLLPTRRNAVRK
jgi:hypothetical protein